MSIQISAGSRNTSLTLPSSITPRLRYLAERLYGLGPRPLYEYLAEIIQGEPALERLEAFARLPAALIASHGGDRMPTFFVIEGGSS
jgi:hypothetical protein